MNETVVVPGATAVTINVFPDPATDTTLAFADLATNGPVKPISDTETVCVCDRAVNEILLGLTAISFGVGLAVGVGCPDGVGVGEGKGVGVDVG